MLLGRIVRFAVGVVVLVFGAALALWLTGPDVRPLADRSCNLAVQVRDWKGNYHPFTVGPENPRWLYLNQISPYMTAAVVSSEDARFYRHHGFDVEALKQAALKDIEERRFSRGGSTISQQVVKNLFLSREKTLVRKLREAMITWQIERALSKRRILELYLNLVELGPDVYGVDRGARFYFQKSARQLNPKEAAFLTAMLPGPKVFNPYKNLRRVERRSRLVLKKMVQAGFITRSAYRAWRSAALNIRGLERKIETITGEAQETVIPPEEALEESEQIEAQPASEGSGGEPADAQGAGTAVGQDSSDQQGVAPQPAEEDTSPAAGPAEAPRQHEMQHETPQ
ncbi:MAG: monofunctional biosynthetic peptidoglycan transglycosylase [Pseudomonadota bacterium]